MVLWIPIVFVRNSEYVIIVVRRHDLLTIEVVRATIHESHDFTSHK